MEKFLAKYNVTKQAAPGIDHCAEPCLCGGYRSKHISQLAWDLKGLDNLANILAAKRPPDDKGDPLDKYLMGFGLWRPMAHKPEKSREPWHVELLSLQHQDRLDRIKSHAMQKADYKDIVRRHHLDSR
jgi:hypothetical protein